MKKLFLFVMGAVLMMVTSLSMAATTTTNAGSVATTSATAAAATTITSKKITLKTLSKAQQGEIEAIVHDYLVSNPSVLIEVSHALQAQQRTEMIKHAESAIKENSDALFTEAKSFTGNAKGDVTLVEFFDYKCLHCKRMAPVISELMEKDKNLKVVYKPLPIFGSTSSYAAKAALAAAKQNKFKAFHQAMFKAKSNFTNKQIIQIARKAGLNIKKLKKDMRDPQLDKTLEANIQLAQKIGVAGTPAFIVGANVSSADKIAAYFLPGATQKGTLAEAISKARTGS